MERCLYKELERWSFSENRRPLVLFGARQVGKTWLLKEFGSRRYKNVAYVSFDRNDAAVQLVTTEKSAEKLLRGLSAVTGVDIVPGDTLVILDEIQDCPIALTRLKALAEDARDYHIAACGSLLGIALHEGVSYPVGQVDEMYLYPMTFGEFLLADGREQMKKIVDESDWSMINAISSEYVDLLRQYYYVGGMPAAVKAYVEGKGLNAVRTQQKQILNDYDRDFSKHAPARVVPRIRMVWQSIVSQLAKENKNYCCPLNIKSRFEPIVVQRIQTRKPIPSPHTRMCEGYFSASSASGGLSSMAANDSSQSFSGCSRNPCTSM